jgi:hypothetical protein
MLPWKLRAWIKVILNTKREREREREKGYLKKQNNSFIQEEKNRSFHDYIFYLKAL